jgi:uncharacterized damage-inducible protein DinB
MDADERIDTLLARLAAIPERIARALAGWSEAELRAAPGDGGWSAAEILAHLRAADDITTPRIYMVLVRDHPPLPAFDDRRWAELAGYAAARVQESLALFTLRRAEVVRMLRATPPALWVRSGLHEDYGTMPLLVIVRRLVEHEEEHCAQLEAIRGRGDRRD